jgi:hypothetical protein
MINDFYQFAFGVNVRFELEDGILSALPILVDVVRQEGVVAELVAVHSLHLSFKSELNKNYC